MCVSRHFDTFCIRSNCTRLYVGWNAFKEVEGGWKGLLEKPTWHRVEAEWVSIKFNPSRWLPSPAVWGWIFLVLVPPPYLKLRTNLDCTQVRLSASEWPRVRFGLIYVCCTSIGSIHAKEPTKFDPRCPSSLLLPPCFPLPSRCEHFPHIFLSVSTFSSKYHGKCGDLIENFKNYSERGSSVNSLHYK